MIKFNKTSNAPIDLSNWTVEIGGSWDNDELQYYATAAMNIVRLGAWWAGVPREKTRELGFQKLKTVVA
jgi:hypothetical protein